MAQINRQTLSTRSRLLLWAGLLVGPTVWMVQLFGLYALEDLLSCAPASRTPGEILGIHLDAIALAGTAIVAGLTVAAGLGAYSGWRQARALGDEAVGYRWMGIAGIMFSLLFLLVIVIKVAPVLILGVCETL
jgi:hypothetical protein